MSTCFGLNSEGFAETSLDIAPAETILLRYRTNASAAADMSRAPRRNSMNSTTRMTGRRQDFLRGALALLVALLLTRTAQAQSPTGTILGHVKDTTGAVVPAATVTATHLGTQYARTTTTDAEGQYALRLLPVGQYKVDIGLTGFKSFSQTGILLEVGRNARVDATLETGGIEEVVSVTADATL